MAVDSQQNPPEMLTYRSYRSTGDLMRSEVTNVVDTELLAYVDDAGGFSW